jgi:serine/threonine protein phosphatase PrpC
MKAFAKREARPRPGIEVAGLSDVGCLRENNEDRYAYWEPAKEKQLHDKGRLAVIADGMGGHEGGQEASRIAVETVQEVYGETSDGSPRSLLMAGFQAAHERILTYANDHPALQGMGTTCTAVALLGHDLYYAHVGDSRLYLVREGKISRLSRDHSYVERLLEQGVISPEEAASHPQRNILLMAMGAGPEIAPESPEQPIPLEVGDVLLLCTDGLWSQVSDGEMMDAVASGSLKKSCRELVQKAKERGGPDNITVAALRIE